MPAGGSHTGRYVLLQVCSPRGYPNDEDYILLARGPGEFFRPAYAVRVPFDEEPPLLLDYAANPMVAVVYQDFTLAWTDDGGRTIRTPPHVPEGLFKLSRFGDHRIDWLRLEGEYFYIKTAAGRRPARRQAGHAPFVDQVWRVRLDAAGPAERADAPAETREPTVNEDIFARVVGSQLMIRSSPDSPWVELTPDRLLAQLQDATVQDATVDFFGGTGARWIR